MRNVRPKKALGQHFLTDLSIAAHIAAVIDDYRGMPIMEVGPGTGVLTRFLLDAGHDLTVVEIDTESIDYLSINFPELSERIIEHDFLELDLREIFGENQFCVIGNYPYNISSQIFFKILDYKDKVVCCAGMLQREVAERITASPGTKARGILSVLLQAWYDVEYLFTVDEKAFNPPPKVKSGVIKLRRNNTFNLGCDEQLFKTVVKTSFGQRRKTLYNSLKGFIPNVISIPDKTLLTHRPEQLSVDEFVALTNLISKSLK